MRLRRVIHSGAHNLVEHPHRDLAIVALVVIINLTAKHALPSRLAAADDDISSVQRMPRILHPLDTRLVIILAGTCTTARAPISHSRKDAPEPRAVERPEQGRVVALPQVGGLHHRYVRRAA